MVDGGKKRYNPYGGQFSPNSSKLQMHLPFDPAITILGIYLMYVILHI